MAKPRTHSRRLRNKVLILGYDPNGLNVYSAYMSTEKYEAGKHPWDKPEKLKALALRTLRGFIFDADGVLHQEFESQFDLVTGVFEQGWSRNDEGIIDEY
ncbi:MAG: hypothetical protein JO218_16010 [Burkholderiales bacterium]|nr:hypothetical protein [Burkholderiales bacterium]